MRKNWWFWLTVVFAIAALVASAILLVDYVRPAPVFCAADGGCGKVKQTILARPFGVPLPAIGLAGMFGLALLTLVPGRVARSMQLVVASGAGLVGGLLIVTQFLMNAFCPYCAVVDGSALVLAGLSIYRWRKSLDAPPGRRVVIWSIVLFGMAIAAPLDIGFHRRALAVQVPDAIAQEMKRTGKGKVTVVDFVDFECPFCRLTHTELKPLLAERSAKLRVVRKHVPLRMHPHAMDAAKAACCAESLGKGEEMAEALFSAEPAELTREGCEKLATQQGLDAARFHACVDDPATEARIEKDREAFRASQGQGLPTIWVDSIKLEGAQDRASIATALDYAIKDL